MRLPVANRRFLALCAPLSFYPLLLAQESDARIPHRRNNKMPIGTVKFFNDAKGFGFIQPEDGTQDAFVHISAVERAGMRTLSQGQRLSYELQQDRPGKMSASDLKLEDPAATEAQ
jgi:CspA family cold shock protein